MACAGVGGHRQNDQKGVIGTKTMHDRHESLFGVWDASAWRFGPAGRLPVLPECGRSNDLQRLVHTARELAWR